jgi:hypothetical protein
MLKTLETINVLAAFLTLFGTVWVAWGSFQAWEVKRVSHGSPVLRGSLAPLQHRGEAKLRSPAPDQSTPEISL